MLLLGGLVFASDVLFCYFDIISASLQLELYFIIRQLYFYECNHWCSYNCYISWSFLQRL